MVFRRGGGDASAAAVVGMVVVLAAVVVALVCGSRGMLFVRQIRLVFSFAASYWFFGGFLVP